MKRKLAGAAILIGMQVWAGEIAVQPSAVLFENDQVKVIRALEKAHVKSKFHDHKLNRVMIYLQPGLQRFEYQDGKTADMAEWHAGDAKWSAASGMHSAEVTSDNPFNIIEIELKLPGNGKPIVSSLDPVKVDPRDYKVEFENDQVRVIRVRVGPHGITPNHEHPLNRITVFLTDQDFRVTDSHGTVTQPKHKAGDAAWGTPVVHTEENLSDQPFEVVAIELKN